MTSENMAPAFPQNPKMSQPSFNRNISESSKKYENQIILAR